MSKKIILIVDDETIVLRFLMHVFDAAGFISIGAATFAEAVEICKNQLPDFVLSDVKLRGRTTGPELLRWLKENSPQTPCLLMTGYRAEGIDADNCDVIYKPFSPTQIVARVRAMLEPLQ